MKLQYANLTDQCGSFEEYDGHVVHGLVTEDNKVALATFIHRRSAGLQTIDGATLESGGGCRITLPNGSDHASFSVGMLLSSMMSQKFAAIFGDSKLALGGGKTVVFTHNVPEVLGDVRVNEVRQELWRAFAEEILARINTYLTSFDMGMTREDLEYIACYAPRGLVIGHRDGTDPSPVTADGVLLALEETWRMYGDDGDDVAALYEKQTFALQGIGNVGFALLSRLLERGVRHITIADTNAQSIERARRLDGDIIRVVEPDAIYGVKARIFMPCAKGGILNSRTISNMRSSTNMIVGSANNPLAEAFDGIRLYRAGIIYAPAEVANAGGAIDVVCNATGKKSADELHRITDILRHVYKESDFFDEAPSEVINRITRGYIEKLRPAA